MTQPTPITVHHTPGGRLSNGMLSGQGSRTVYVVAGHEFATPRAAIRAADAIDRHGRYVSPLRAQQSPPECPPSPAGTGALDASG